MINGQWIYGDFFVDLTFYTGFSQNNLPFHIVENMENNQDYLTFLVISIVHCSALKNMFGIDRV